MDDVGTKPGAQKGTDCEDMILEQVADDHIKKEALMKMSAVVDSGAEANALLGLMVVDLTEAKCCR